MNARPARPWLGHGGATQQGKRVPHFPPPTAVQVTDIWKDYLATFSPVAPATDGRIADCAVTPAAPLCQGAAAAAVDTPAAAAPAPAAAGSLRAAAPVTSALLVAALLALL